VTGVLRRFFTHPAVLILLIAPYFGEGLSGSTPPLTLLLPWNLAFMAALYGCGALICREVAHRFGLGFPGFLLLAVAYAIWEEALVDRYWFDPAFWHDSGVGDYSVAWHTNVLLAVHLTAFHTAISISSAVLVVERLVPDRRHRPWSSRPGLALAAVALAVTPVIYGEFDRHPPIPVLVAAAALLVAVIGDAFLTARRRAAADPRPARPPRRSERAAADPRSARLLRRGVAVVAFTAVLAHWVATYGIPATGVPWPLGVLVAVTPIAAAALVLRRMGVTDPYGLGGIRVVAGLLTFFALLDLFVGLGGRYDLSVGGLVTAYVAYRLGRRRPGQHADDAGGRPQDDGGWPHDHDGGRPGHDGGGRPRDDGDGVVRDFDGRPDQRDIAGD
jgi:hypothetical protein